MIAKHKSSPVDMITLTIGGDDLGFGKIIINCTLPEWVVKQLSYSEVVKSVTSIFTPTIRRRTNEPHQLRKDIPNTSIFI